MGVLQLLGLETNYTPSGLYSFEFFKRDPKNGNLLRSMKEVYLLIPPISYSLKEGYKLSVNRTISGGWVDDFGNDFKDLKISGELNSYFLGTIPDSMTNSVTNYGPVTNTVVDFKNTVNNVKRIFEAKKTYISGIDEFFKLRFLLSRFRDKEKENDLNAVIRAFPDLADLFATIGYGGEISLNDKIGIVYHDYDENNHFEVIINDFASSRSASDPFTVKFDISAVCIRPFRSKDYNKGSISKKEDPLTILKQTKDSFSKLMNDLTVLKNLPANLVSYVNDYGLTLNSMLADFNKVLIDATYINNFISKSIETARITMDTTNKVVVNTLSPLFIYDSVSTVLQNYIDENPAYAIMDDSVNDLLSILNKINQICSGNQGIDKYYKRSPAIKIIQSNNTIYDDVSDQDERVLRDKVYYDVKMSDTLASIALLFYGDSEKGNIISDANQGLSPKDFENNAMVGVNIIIPMEQVLNSGLLDNNLIYYKNLDLATNEERQLQVLGSDFQLDNLRNIVVDGTGDRALVYGEDAYLNNLVDRLIYPEGTLKENHPDWGINIDIGDVPTSIFFKKLVEMIERQIGADPRTEYCFIDKEKINIDGDSIYIPLLYKPFTGSEDTLDVGKIIKGF